MPLPLVAVEELVEIVRRLQTAEGTEAELDALMEKLERSVPHPEVSDLIFYSEREMTAEEIVAEVLSYKPILL